MKKTKCPRKGILKTLMLIAFTLFFGLKGKALIADSNLKRSTKPANKSSKPANKKSKKASPSLSGRKQQQVASGHVPPKFSISYTLNGFGGKHEKKMREALGQLTWVVRSEAFKQKVLNHRYKGQKTFYQNKGLTNEEIYDAILKGAETLNPIEDHKMNLQMTLYYSETNTVGYTYPNTNEIWVNRRYFEKYTLGEVANNAMHEWLHKIGFEHSYYHNGDRPHTVPYAIGEIVEEIINGLN